MRRIILVLPMLLLACTRNLPPLLDEFTTSSTNIQPCQSVSLSVLARDPENSGLRYSFKASPPIGIMDSSGANATWLLTPTTTKANQVITFTATISDGLNIVQTNPLQVKISADTKAKNCSSISGVVRPGVQFAALRGYENAEMRPGEALVQFKDSSAALRLQAVGLEVKTWITSNTALIQAPTIKAQARASGLNSRVTGTAALETLEFVNSLRLRTDVQSAEPNTILKLQAVPNDPLYPKQWHYGALNLPTTWDGFPSEADVGTGVIVGIIDSGILWDNTDPTKQHPDFNCEVAPGKPKVLPGYDFVRNDNNPFDEDATLGGRFHGTHVAGTVGACSNNALGVAGVAWKSQILPIKALDSNTGDIGAVAKGIYWAAGISSSPLGTIPNNPNPANIINMSLGGQQSPSPVLQAAVKAATEKGIVIVVAAGNGDPATRKPIDAANFTPANLQGVIVVGAVAQDKSRASYSNFGSTVALVAPGGDFNKNFLATDGVLSTMGCGAGDVGQFFNPSGGEFPPCNNWGYGSYNGTSMASPHVAGIIALMMSKNAALRGTDPNNWVRIRSYLTDSSSLTGLTRCLQGCGAGLLDANMAVQKASTLPDIGAVIVRTTQSELLLGSSGTQTKFVVKNIGDAPANITISATGAGLSVSPNTINLAVNQTQELTINLNRTGINGENAGRINLLYGTRELEQRVYYNQGLGVLTNPAGYYLRIYKIDGQLPNGEPNRIRLNYPDTPVGTNGTFAFDNLEPGQYDLTAYRENNINPDGTINISELGERRGLFTFNEPITTEIALEESVQIICSRTGTVTDGATKCPGK